MTADYVLGGLHEQTANETIGDWLGLQRDWSSNPERNRAVQGTTIRADILLIEGGRMPVAVECEYVRSRVTWNGFRVDGVKYKSSVRPGHTSYVFFADQANIHSIPTREHTEDCWLKLLNVDHTILDCVDRLEGEAEN